MDNTKTILLALVIILSSIVILGLLTIGFVLLNFNLAPKGDTDINSFEDCVAAGYPVMESYPEQCRTSDGKHFVNTKQIAPTTDPSTPIPDDGNGFTPGEPTPGTNPDDVICIDLCGDNQCAEVVCLGTGCPCAETRSSCPEDCN